MGVSAMLTRYLITSVIFFSGVFSAQAQQVNRSPSPYDWKLQQKLQQKQQQQQQILEPYSGTGTIEAIGPNKIQMVTQSNGTWMIFLQPTTIVTTVGQAKLEYLHAGLYVEFRAELDQRRQVMNTINELTVISQSGDKQPGIYLDGAEKANLHTSKNMGAGPCTVIGRVSVVHNNNLQVQAGHVSLSCELAENARVHLEISDLSMARKGDRISVTGMKNRGLAGQVQAKEVKVDLAETLTGSGTKYVPGKPKAQYHSKPSKPKDNEGLPVPTEQM
jgi:hypothetical protein